MINMLDEMKGFSLSLRIIMILVMGVIAMMIAISMLSGSTGGLENLSNSSSQGGFV